MNGGRKGAGVPDDGTPEEEQRLRALYAAHYGRVLNFARRRVVDAESAQDVAAETFLIAWRRIDKVPRGSDDELPWLYAVARNVLANQLRGQRRGGRLTARVGRTAPVAETEPDHAGGVVEALHLRQALAALSEHDQETLRLIAWDGLDTAAAARVVGCSARTFAVRLHRARKRLERELARHEEPSAGKDREQLARLEGERA